MNVSMKKIGIGIVLVLIIAGSAYWWDSTKDERMAKAELETMIKYVQRQALEIAIIEQASKLTDYRQQLAAQKPPAINGVQVQGVVITGKPGKPALIFQVKGFHWIRPSHASLYAYPLLDNLPDMRKNQALLETGMTRH